MSTLALVRRQAARGMTDKEAARFLRQIFLTVKYSDIEAAIGKTHLQVWEEQVAIPAQQSVYEMATKRGPAGFEKTWDGFGNARWGALDYKWYVHPDKLRNRIVYALQEYFVISGATSDIFDGREKMSNFFDILYNNVWGNFRTLLEQVSRSIEMSIFLTHYRNRKEDPVSGRMPDENYAREIMQLFTIGLWELKDDNTRKKTGELDKNDPRYVPGGTADVPTYGQEDITNIARVFTGMCLRNKNNVLGFNNITQIQNEEYFLQYGNPQSVPLNYWATPLEFDNAFHEMSLPKVALHGRVKIPVGTNGDTSLKLFLDALFNHPCMAPFFCSRMIRLLITSNPSREYISRVVAVFKNDGNGVRGNLAAVFKAIFLDQEARAPISKNAIAKPADHAQHRMMLAGMYGGLESTENGNIGWNGTVPSVTIADTSGTLIVSTGTYTIGQAFNVRGIFNQGGNITGYTQGKNYFVGSVTSSTIIRITGSRANALTGTFTLTTIPGPTTATFHNVVVGSLTATGAGSYPGGRSADYNRIGWWTYYQNSGFHRAGSVFGRFPTVYAPPNSAVSRANRVAPELFHYEEGGVDHMYFNGGGTLEAIGNNAMSAQDYTDLTSNRIAVINRLSLVLTGGSAPQEFLNSILTWVNSNSFYTQDDSQKRATFRTIAWYLWMSPWAIVRT